ncbi:SpoIIE family protein phosphatase [Streptomyces cocklensis]|nr:SpoIIE family protein phosphatase [Actinacidiphila cocklensis]MDD1058838.1 SpoIIE family protein phosphatase [Actinacidiphila cocklensis]
MRLQWLDSLDPAADVSDVLAMALPQAAAGLAALGSMVHLSGRDDRTLRLASASSLPTALAQAWELLDIDGGTALAPVRAVLANDVAWSTAQPPSLAPGPQPGVLSAPVTVGGAPVGALSVLAAHEPPADRKLFLRTLAAAIGVRLAAARQQRDGTAPWWQVPLDRRVMRRVRVGTWSWDLASGRLDFDEPAEDLVHLAGLDLRSWDRQIDSWMARVHPDDRPGVDEAIAQSMREGSAYAVEYRVVDREGRAAWLEFRGAFEYDAAGQPVRMVGTAWNTTPRRTREAWLVGLLEWYPRPLYVLAGDGAVEWVNRAGRAWAEEHGSQGTDCALWESVPALREQGVQDLVARARAAPGTATTLTVSTPGRDSGAAAYTELTAVGIGDYVSITLADVTARTLADHRSAAMSELAEALIRALTMRDVVEVVVRHMLPMVGATGLVAHDLTGPRPKLIDAVGYAPAFLEALADQGWPQRLASSELSGAQLLFITSPAEFRRRWPRVVPVADQGRNQAWAVLPLIAGGRHLGSCVISWPAQRTFDADDRAFLSTVGVVLSKAMGNAAAYEEAQERAERLQKELLPGELPDLVAVQTAARWRAAAGQDVGGDWYDTVPLPGGRTLAVAGDVAGHGLEQAITMGIIRHAVLTIASLDLPLDELLARVGDVAVRLAGPLPDQTVYATCVMVVYDATTGVCEVASAGHLAPVVHRPGRQPAVLDVAAGPPLGLAQVIDPLPVEVTTTVLEPGSTLLLYTNGTLGSSSPDPAPLVEALARRTAAAPAPADPDRRARWLTELCGTITHDLPPDPDHQDDSALLLLNTGRVPPEDVMVADLPLEPRSAARARDLTAIQLGRWGLAELTDSAALIVSELAGNVIRHTGRGLDGADMIRLRLLHLDGGVVTEVYDGTESAPRVRHPSLDDEFGRGLQIVAVASRSRWGARYVPGGKCIWAQLDPDSDEMPHASAV